MTTTTSQTPLQGASGWSASRLFTYPFEWSFRQLKEAALTTLEINILALDPRSDAQGRDRLQLPDQVRRDDFHRPRVVRAHRRPFAVAAIRSVSAGISLAPLAIASTTGVDAKPLAQGGNRRSRYLGNVETSAASIISEAEPSPAHSPAWTRNKENSSMPIRKSAPDKGGMARGVWSKQHDLLMHLKRCVEKLKIQKTTSAWTQYCDRNTYDPEQFSCKEAFVTSVCAET